MRLGLQKMLSDANNPWELLALTPAEIDAFDAETYPVNLVLLGVDSCTSAILPLIRNVETKLRPERTLILADVCNIAALPSNQCQTVFGCASKSSSVEALKAAIQLGLAGGECFRAAPAHRPDINECEAPPTRPVSAAYKTNRSRSAWLADTRKPSPTSTANRVRAEQDRIAARTEDQKHNIIVMARQLGITPRQYEVLTLLSRGYPLKTVASILNISPATAKAHAAMVYQRLDVNSREEAVFAARQRGAMLD